MPSLPQSRGPLSAHVLAALTGPPDEIAAIDVDLPAEPLDDDDLQLALYCCYELHYRGFDGVDPDWEWSPSLLALRAQLERSFEAALTAVVGSPCDTVRDGEMDLALRAIAEANPGPPLARYLERHATRGEFEEFVIHRSAYQLKEADPHSFGLPRIDGAAKAAMVEIQADEYGGGCFERMHSELFAQTMRELGLDAEYGTYVDVLPGTTLATVNLISLFGLRR